MSQYYTIVTDVGTIKIAEAITTSTLVNITQIAVGDGNGSEYAPTGQESALRRETWRGQVDAVTPDANNPNWIKIEGAIPANVGGFTLREVGLFDDSGTLIAIGNYPSTYKPMAGDGTTLDLVLNTIINVQNADVVNTTIDPTVAIASKQYVQDSISPIIQQLTQTDNKIDTLVVNVTDARFGAVGDGVTDDSLAIKAAHDYANTHKIAVAYPGQGSYYIGGAAGEITINTAVAWGGATLIIDQSSIGDGLFNIPTEHDWIDIDLATINNYASQFSQNASYVPCLKELVPQNQVVQIEYTVAGVLTNDNTTRQVIKETFVHTQNGKIIGNIIHSAHTILKAMYRKMDTPIELENLELKLIGKLETPKAYVFNIQRDNVVVEQWNISREFSENSVRKEVIQVLNCFNTHLKNINSYNPEMTERPYPADDIHFEGYILRVDYAVKTILEDFNAATKHVPDWNSASEYASWGMMATNNQKILIVKNSYLSRIDSHSPINGVYLHDSEIDWVQVCGTGEFYAENTTFTSSMRNVMIGFYGASSNNRLGGQWIGEIKLKDCTYKPIFPTTNDFYMVGYTSTDSFGYRDYIPFVSIDIDNLTIDTKHLPNPQDARFILTRLSTNNPSRGLQAFMPHYIKVNDVSYKSSEAVMLPYLPKDQNSNVIGLERDCKVTFKNVVFKEKGTNLNILDSDVLQGVSLTPSNRKLTFVYDDCKIPIVSFSSQSANLDVVINGGEINSLIANRASIDHAGKITVNHSFVNLKSYNNAYVPLSLWNNAIKFNACRISPYQTGPGGTQSLVDLLASSNTVNYCNACFVDMKDVLPNDVQTVNSNLYKLNNFASNFGMTRFVSVPTSATSSGLIGDWSADANYLYMCYESNKWRRVAVATW